MSGLIILLVILNLAISAFNAWSCGRSWAETKAAGGLSHFMNWCGAVMSASGFTWCYMVILCAVWQMVPGRYHLSDKYAHAVFALGYLVIILPVLGSGIAITVQSWAYYWKERNWKNGAIAGWNSFAQIYNMYQACEAIPESLSFLGGILENDDDDDKNSIWIKLVFAAVILCLIGGIVTTTVIIRVTARNVASIQLERV